MVDLMCGLGPKQIRTLCDNPWIGGYGYTPKQVGDMTLDQIFLLLVDKDNLRATGRKARTRSIEPIQTPGVDKDGFAKGRAADGSPIRARIGGKSKAQMIKEKLEREKKESKQGRRRKRRS